MATKRKKASRGSGGFLPVLAILMALAAVLLWEIGCSRQSGSVSGPGSSVTRLPVRTPSPQAAPAPSPAPTEQNPAPKAEEKPKPRERRAEPIPQEEPPAPKETETARAPEMAPDSSAPAPAAPPSERPAPIEPSPIPTPRHPHPNRGGMAQVYIHGYPGSSRVALTFDAGSSAEPTPKILSVLARHGVHVTFFLTGKWVQQNPDMARRIAAAGHEIGNHSFSHPRFVTLTDDGIASQLRRTEDLIQETTGENPRPLFRPPFGSYNKHVLQELAANGYTAMIYWSLDSLDSVKPHITSGYIVNRVLTKVKDGDIVLMHCGSQPTADALEEIVSTLQSRGYTIVKASELLGI